MPSYLVELAEVLVVLTVEPGSVLAASSKTASSRPRRSCAIGRAGPTQVDGQDRRPHPVVWVELEMVGLVGGVVSILYGPKWTAPVFQLPATSRVRTWRYQLPSAN